MTSAPTPTKPKRRKPRRRFNWYKLVTSKIVWVNAISLIIGIVSLITASGIVTDDTSIRWLGVAGDVFTLIFRIWFTDTAIATTTRDTV